MSIVMTKPMEEVILEDIRRDQEHRHSASPWILFAIVASIGTVYALMTMYWLIWLILAAVLVLLHFSYVRPKLEEAFVFELTSDDLSVEIDECLRTEYIFGTDGAPDENYIYFRKAGKFPLPESSWALRSRKLLREFHAGKQYYLVTLRGHRDPEYFYPISFWMLSDTTGEVSEENL